MCACAPFAFFTPSCYPSQREILNRRVPTAAMRENVVVKPSEGSIHYHMHDIRIKTATFAILPVFPTYEFRTDVYKARPSERKPTTIGFSMFLSSNSKANLLACWNVQIGHINLGGKVCLSKPRRTIGKQCSAKVAFGPTASCGVPRVRRTLHATRTTPTVCCLQHKLKPEHKVAN